MIIELTKNHEMSGVAGLFAALERLDLHPKTVKDFAVRTKTGAAVSIASILIALLLFVSELRWYTTVEVEEHMEVDDMTRGAKMRINFDLVFPSLPCALLSVDAVDASGEHQLEILHDVFKRRLDTEGNSIAQVERSDRRTLKSREELLKEKQKAIAEGRHEAPKPAAGSSGSALCGDCYGAGEPGQCCSTCEEVRALYKRKGWQFSMENVEQCKSEGFYGDVNAQVAAKEGCNVYGHLEVPKVPGNLHFAPSHSVQHAYTQVQDLLAFTLNNFNISHRVNMLSFGPYYPGAHYPLDDRERMLEEGSGSQQYFVKLVPTEYTPLGGPSTTVHTYQFSVTEHLRRLDPRTATAETVQGIMPGVSINYELSPLRARIVEKRRSFGHFLTRVFAIIGGVFVVMGLVDALLFRVIDDYRKASRRKAGGVFGGGLNVD